MIGLAAWCLCCLWSASQDGLTSAPDATPKDGGMRMIGDGVLQVEISSDATNALALSCADWDGFSVAGLAPSVVLDGTAIDASNGQVDEASPDALSLRYTFGESAQMTVRLESRQGAGVRMSFRFRNTSAGEAVLNRVTLLGTPSSAGTVRFGSDPVSVRVFEQGNYWGKVVPLVAAAQTSSETGSAEPAGAPPRQSHSSDFVSVAYDRGTRMAFLSGFLSSERWMGRIEIESAPDEANGGAWRIGFDAGDLLVGPGEEIALEDVLFQAGSNPWRLLESYGDAVRERHHAVFQETPVISWCSWYPYRLGVTEDRILETARIAADRLKPLGLSVLELDLGWEKGQLPSAFEENDQFPHGLKWLSDELDKLGFAMGVWKAPFTISEFDPIVKEHPEWLILDESGQPAAYWTWFWEPHGNVYILDLTHPGAQAWLKTQIGSLHERGVRYFKADFVGCVSHDLAKRRYDRRIVAGGGVEAARIGARIIREALPDALLLNCGGPEMPGTGQWPLLYSCSDTGNTGFIVWDFQRDNYQSLACHLFKNRRWGVIQPSCLCVGAPGSAEEARLRATAAFLAGGQIDISDTLTTLPEDRWAILTSTLPQPTVSATPVDLFDPVCSQSGYDYSATCSNEAAQTVALKENPPGSVWHLHVKADWDEWDLVGVFSFQSPASEAQPELGRFAIPFAILGLSDKSYWGYEFWTRQFLGSVPGMRKNPRDYKHPGDFQDLLAGDAPGTLDVAFVGPGARLICLRSRRDHPWILGTSFHQSCGTELAGVKWDAATLTLSGELRRPAGETGVIVFSDGGRAIVSARVAGIPAVMCPGANGAWVLPIAVQSNPERWTITFRDLS